MDPPGHKTLSNKSVDAAVRSLPPELKWVRYYLTDTKFGAVYRDVWDVFTGGHWSRACQKHHFMRFQEQSQLEAYKLGVGWIHDNAFTAAKRLRQFWQHRWLGEATIWINEPLGNALHALQDSYSGGHVSRKKVGDDWIIIDIFIYDAVNKQTHGALDQKWETDELGKAAVIAGSHLISRVVKLSLVDQYPWFEFDWNAQWAGFVNEYLQLDLSLAER
jgi:hypothetical protein